MSSPSLVALPAHELLAKEQDWDRERPLIWEAIHDTVWLVGWTLVIAGIIGLVIGVGLSVTRRGGLAQNRPINLVLNLIVNIVRPIPFVILIAALGPVTLKLVGTTIGNEAVLFVMCIGASFAIARIVEQNLVAVPAGTLEAARALGASKLRIIFSVMLPEALGPLILGYTFITIGITDMSALAGIIGGNSLGEYALSRGYQRFDWLIVAVATVIIIVGVQLVQLVGSSLSAWILRRRR